ncbi:hypothetical protein R9X47_27935 [Wukongibacter baidiensis]|uniref:hypothetical protein n=1 Tax=Wukongibacter baidiensis TaxID=1723361 RepID=UPI003D7FB0E5
MDPVNKQIVESVFLANRTEILNSTKKTAIIAMACMLFFLFTERIFSFASIIYISIVSIIIAVIQFLVMKRYKASIFENKIVFEKYGEYEYSYDNISMIIVGDVEVKGSRFAHRVFGIEVFYSEQGYDGKQISSDVFKLKYFKNYDALIDEIKKKCDIHNIKLEDTRE